MSKISLYPQDSAPATGDYALGNKAAAPSTQRFLFSDLISLFFNNVPAGKILPNGLVSGTGTSWTPVEYAGTSSITGWASFTNKTITYVIVGKIAFINFTITGTSNNTSATFTVPFNAASFNGGQSVCVDVPSGLSIDNGSIQSSPARIYIDPAVSTSQVTLVKAMGSGSWTNSGTKDVRGAFWCFVA